MNLSNLKLGQRLRCRNGNVVILLDFLDERVAAVMKPGTDSYEFTVYRSSGLYHCDREHPFDIVGLADDVSAELEKAQAVYDALGERLKELRAAQEAAKAPAKVERWTPSMHPFSIRSFAGVNSRDVRFSGHSEASSSALLSLAPSGSTYPTKAAADYVAAQLNFFLRLHALACEVNGGRFGANAFVLFEDSRNAWRAFEFAAQPQLRNTNRIFVSLEAAEKAADIMTRDGWRIPSYSHV